MSGEIMKCSVILFLLLLSNTQCLLAASLSAEQRKCLAKIDEQVSFIISGIERVNQQYEKIVKGKNWIILNQADFQLAYIWINQLENTDWIWLVRSNPTTAIYRDTDKNR